MRKQTDKQKFDLVELKKMTPKPTVGKAENQSDDTAESSKGSGTGDRWQCLNKQK